MFVRSASPGRREQDMEKKWACQSMCTWAIKKSCDDLGITYVAPEVPLRLKQKLT